MPRLSPEQPMSLSHAKETYFSILLVDANTDLRESRRLLLQSLSLTAVDAVPRFAEVIHLIPESSFDLIVIALDPNEVEAADVAEFARHYWNKAKILLLGTLTGEWDDWIYDEIVDPHWSPSILMEAARNLLQQSAAGRHKSQRAAGNR